MARKWHSQINYFNSCLGRPACEAVYQEGQNGWHEESADKWYVFLIFGRIGKLHWNFPDVEIICVKKPKDGETEFIHEIRPISKGWGPVLKEEHNIPTAFHGWSCITEEEMLSRLREKGIQISDLRTEVAYYPDIPKQLISLFCSSLGTNSGEVE